MSHTVNTEWKGSMKFDAIVSGHHVVMDALPEVGGNDEGPRPKQLLLAALAGCTGMDVVSILKKMRVELEYFNIQIDAEVTDEHPKHYTKMHLIYEFRGKDLDREKLEKAVDLSQERYCGVSALFKKAMKLTYEIKVLS
jgi:putative redox protein